jgi:hypothetical protein
MLSVIMLNVVDRLGREQGGGIFGWGGGIFRLNSASIHLNTSKFLLHFLGMTSKDFKTPFKNEKTSRVRLKKVEPVACIIKLLRSSFYDRHK